MSEEGKKESAGQKDGEENGEDEKSPEPGAEGTDSPPDAGPNRNSHSLVGGGEDQDSGIDASAARGGHEKIMACATAVMAIFTVVLACVAIFQARIMSQQRAAMSGQLSEMGKQTENASLQIEQAERQIGLAEMGIRQALDMNRVEQRAWVSVDAVEAKPLEEGKPAIIDVRIKNFGNTPAKNVVVRHALTVTDPTFKMADLMEEAETRLDGKVESIAVLMPNAPVAVVLRPDLIMSRLLLDGIEKGAVRLRLGIEATYSDIFEQEHLTRFCVHYNPKIKGYDACEEYNYMN